MNKKMTLAMLIAVSAVLGIGTAWTRFSAVATAQAQHQGHDQYDHADHDDENDSHGDQEQDPKKEHADHDDHDDEHEEHGDHDEHGDERGGHEEHEGREEGVVHLNETQLAGLKLTHVEVKRGSLTTMVELPGEVGWNADRLVHVSPRVNGIVSSVEKTLGDRVEVGDVLCVLDSREMDNAKMEYLVDLSRFGVARAD